MEKMHTYFLFASIRVQQQWDFNWADFMQTQQWKLNLCGERQTPKIPSGLNEFEYENARN